ncbi:MAG: hypothetical protein OYH77_00005, partial [Pseudomonadota bacterium]|nr:hypothetical protein [Pseudomonadota bacterium]
HAQQTMILHGEAVACGIAFALLVSFELGERCDYAQSVYDALPIKGQRLRTLLGNLPAADLWQQVMHFVCHDKKSIDARRWILLANGKPSPIPQQVDAKTLYHCWQRLLAL